MALRRSGMRPNSSDLLCGAFLPELLFRYSFPRLRRS